MLTTTTTPAASITVACPRPGLALLTLGGEVDIAALERLNAALTEAGACPEVIVEASGVDFIDCAALRRLLAAARAAGAGGGRLVLRDPSPALARLIAWCHLGEELPAEAARARRRGAPGGGRRDEVALPPGRPGWRGGAGGGRG